MGEEKLVMDIGWLKGREHNEMLARQGSPDLGSLMQPGQWGAAEHDIFGSAGGPVMLGAVRGLVRRTIGSRQDVCLIR